MKKSEIFCGKSVEEAKANAAQSFGVSESDITFTVIDEGKKGFLGIGKTDAKVRAEYESNDAAPVNEIKETVSKATVKNPEKKVETEQPAVAKVSAADDAQTSDNGEETAVSKEIPEEKVQSCKAFIEKVLKAMDIDFVVNIKSDNDGIYADIDSKGSGTVIGRRGETLDSLQYLCSLVINKSEGDYVRITLDSCGYREKRTETLKALAEKISKKVLKTGRSTILEPMNPYERRVIHSTVAKIDGVNSKSVGEEPYRKVVIASDNPRRNDKYRKGGKGHGKPHRAPRSLDLKTSFEKDYKKPKPEDDINAGLYGKIEI